MVGERRSQIVRREDQNRGASEQPSAEQLSLFTKRVKRAMRDEKSRHFFCVASGENDFRGHADVLRVLEWIEKLAKEKKISEDEKKRGLEELEKVSHAETKKMEDLSAGKEKEILQVK